MEGPLLAHNNLHQIYGERLLQDMVGAEQITLPQKIHDILQHTGGFHVVAEAISCGYTLAIIEHIPIDLVFVDLALDNNEEVQLPLRLKWRTLPPHIITFSTTIHDLPCCKVC